MKRTIFTSYLALLAVMLMAIGAAEGRGAAALPTAAPSAAAAPAAASQVTASPPALETARPEAPQTVAVLCGGETSQMEMRAYLEGVVAAEMPASFPIEALKAQAVAARTYAIYCAASGKHGEAGVCTDFGCCQAWMGEDGLRQRWGEDYEKNLGRISLAVEETAGEYLSYMGEPAFAAFHSSSAGATEDCGAIWSALPYLVSVSSPETAEEVPNYVSTVECAPLDFRDTLLYAEPAADFTGEESSWIGEIKRDGSGRVSLAVFGGTEYAGTRIRELFGLRSTAFELEYTGAAFVFTVTGSGHGVGMSQYGAKTMAENGEDYARILAHYYPGTTLSG